MASVVVDVVASDREFGSDDGIDGAYRTDNDGKEGKNADASGIVNVAAKAISTANGNVGRSIRKGMSWKYTVLRTRWNTVL